MIRFILLLLGALRSAFRGRAALVLENVALRQQLAAFAPDRRRPRVTPAVARQYPSGWAAGAVAGIDQCAGEL